ncbi:hypothetical protein OZX73_07950 [Bifidobacterium sp. ESL0775]|uniref:hypothetical protein n=1 Tax=Bifidobacterium sp. ESL0775 TaxID=2983230 RepID=UPI0023F87838|nr:hypothetical protein [Bifidobacterium sp. ESL0775]WEV69176.1 hypothetical protein OZX73_07950 [Bifidobacterium sp. ESL0775]
MGKKHGKKITKKNFKMVDNLDTTEKRLEDRLFLMQMAMDEYDEILGGTLERSVSWYLMCSWYGLSSMQSALLIARLATLLDASQTGHKWTPHVHAHEGKHGLEIYAKKDKSKREKGPAFDVTHIRMVMRSVMTKAKMESITDEQVMRFARTLQDIAAREEEREAKDDRKDSPDSAGAVAFEDAKEYADPDALDDVDDVDDDGGADDDEAEDVDVPGDDDLDVEASEGLDDADADAEEELDESEETGIDPDDDFGDGADAQTEGGKDAPVSTINDPLAVVPELKRLDLGKSGGI